MDRTFSEIRQVNLGSMFDSQNLRIDNTNIALQTLQNKTIYLQILGVKYQKISYTKFLFIIYAKKNI